jgi:hypothetical protein
MSTIGFLELPSITPEARALFDEDVAEDGYVMNVTKLWSHNAVLVTSLFDLMGQAVADQDLSFRQRGIPRRSLRVDPGRFVLLPRVGVQAGGGVRSRPRGLSDSRDRRRVGRRRARLGLMGPQGGA